VIRSIGEFVLSPYENTGYNDSTDDGNNCKCIHLALPGPLRGPRDLLIFAFAEASLPSPPGAGKTPVIFAFGLELFQDLEKGCFPSPPRCMLFGWEGSI
jgi:hypothetical protein